MKPTSETYAELQRAYEYFNDKLFDATLPECLITLQREKNTFGYFSADRFVSKEQGKTDEIAMNPTYFSIRTIEQTLSTLAHEISHLWQQHFGKPGRARYHNKEWADKMQAIGLMPSSTGKEGGKRTGDRMSHYIIQGGLFDKACTQLLTQDYKISWADRFPPRRAIVEAIGGDEQAAGLSGPGTNTEPGGIDISLLSAGIESSPAIDELNGWGIDIDDIPAAKVQTRAKLSCPKCRTNVWGKATLNIVCGDCKSQYTVAI